MSENIALMLANNIYYEDLHTR